MFKRVLIANRGEIAVRIIRALREMGIESVAVYSTADRDSLFVKLADIAVCIGGPQPADSYLNIQNIVSAAVLSGADAIHPGFGFLSENAEFARVCAECGVIFIGPEAKTIELMGNKSNARSTMKKHGVPVVPGSNQAIKNIDAALEIADQIGYPVMLKAAAGGGGKGIRAIKDREDLIKKFPDAQRETKLSFDDDDMYIEKIIQSPKHVEVQVMGDSAGNILAFPERDCSLQRGHQKMVEESPCSLINSSEREYLMSVSAKAAKAINYLNTGTFEFLMDDQHHFYFMEMNTRLQVEHPITEMVTGIDLVKMQIRVASGEKISLKQSDIKIHGTAIECRINSEDPFHNFLPQAGKIKSVHFPLGCPGARVDSAIENGSTIPPFYDSMIAKLIAHGSNRKEALAIMDRMLDEMSLVGVKSNLDFQQRLLHSPAVLKGNTTTDYIEKEFLPYWQAQLAEEKVG
ncbi:acetyl-CoA carboxylase biotin carboxylase subunit [Oenococcus oeni]|uniref:biotin carboxylase n=1 Tax=Oenococcus oeni TaxID=1247 RepID=A0AAJ2P1D8_OENOE|nr:acetyl-CoA carboxylase biotin carboxylase subunit [Oenococcus oeni]MDV7714327.1 acetyl-CoA carboxylase biotin carboxylase subunit [Oenococcus oeni]